MEQSKLIVTLTIGEKYRRHWKYFCEANWRQYANKYGYDLLCIDTPLDTSARAQNRSPAWQKCLILGQNEVKNYTQVVWLDSDIIINVDSAPSIVEGVPVDKVGAASGFAAPTAELFAIANQRNVEYNRSIGGLAPGQASPAEFYANHGVRNVEHREVVQTGVLVLSPLHHREVMERTYFEYEGRTIDTMYEMPPLSHNLLKENLIEWIDFRFNYVWYMHAFLHYPFLFALESKQPPEARWRNKLMRLLGSYPPKSIKRACLLASFANSYFLHFASARDDMPLLDPRLTSWRDSQLSVW